MEPAPGAAPSSSGAPSSPAAPSPTGESSDPAATMPSHADRKDDRDVQRVALYGIIVSLVLVAIKGGLAAFSGSLVLTATAVDSAVDVVGAVALWAGLRLSIRKSSRFPYGLYKIENVLQILVAILIFVGAYEIGAQAIAPGDDAPTITWWVLAGVGVTILITLAYSLYATSRGKRTNSPALVADGRHRLVDVFSAVLALIAVASTYIGFDIDRYMAFPILAIVVYSGWGLLRDGMKVLLDASVDPRTWRAIEDLLEADPLVTQVRRLTARSAGRYVFVEASVAVRTEDLAKAHAAADRLEQTVRDQLPIVDHITLHLEPQRPEILTVAVPLGDHGTRVSEEFGSAPRFLFARVRSEDGEILERQTRDNPHTHEERQKGIATAEWLVRHAVDVVIAPHDIKKGPAYVLSDAGVELFPTDPADLDAALEAFCDAVCGGDGPSRRPLPAGG
jgi:cation diffusion facilitator family transporter